LLRKVEKTGIYDRIYRQTYRSNGLYTSLGGRQMNDPIDRGIRMRKVLFFSMLCTVFMLFGGGMILAQESDEEFLENFDLASKEDYIMLIYEGSHDNQLLAVNKLAEMATGGDEEVYQALVFGLQQGTIYVRRKFNKVINDFWDVRAVSAYALGEMGDKRALFHLHNTLEYDPDNYVRAAAIVAIGKIGDPESIKTLLRVIKTSSSSGIDDTVVLGCVNALGDIGDRQAFLPLLEVMRGDFRRSIRNAAREALLKLEW
jgi:hypothetical protein